MKSPSVCEYRKLQGKDILHFLLIYIKIAIPLAIVGFIVCKIFDISRIPYNLTPLKLFIGVILAPIYEEILFRSLLKFNRINISLFLGTIAVFIVYCIAKSRMDVALLWSVLFFCLIILLTVLSKDQIATFISSQFKFVFYISILLFGLIHIFNFTGNVYYLIIFSFILTGPQLVIGSVLGYIRMNYGLAYSILFHMLVNSSLILSYIF